MDHLPLAPAVVYLAAEVPLCPSGRITDTKYIKKKMTDESFKGDLA
jgi:hypothetical protein